MSTSSASIGTDKTKIAQLEQKIADQGTQVQNLVSKYDAVQGQLNTIKAKIATDQGSLVNDHKAETKAAKKVRTWAVDAYVNAATGTASSFAVSDASTLPQQQIYLGVASGSLATALTNLQDAQHKTAVVQTTLKTEEAQTAATLAQLAPARSAAESAVAADRQILNHVNNHLLGEINAANERRAAAKQAAEEKALANTEQQSNTQQATTDTTPAAPVVSTPGKYSNPLRSVHGVSPERIDQGVDYNGSGPVYAIGDGVVISTVVGGWPGGTFISYKLSDGPAAGLVVYAAEDIEPTVHPGQTVSSSTVIGQEYEGSSGIETGWCDSSGYGTTMAADNGQYYGSNTTAFGYNFSQLLQSLGAPGGQIQNSPPTGSLPASWPRW